jgi:hypothetical protein
MSQLTVGLSDQIISRQILSCGTVSYKDIHRMQGARAAWAGEVMRCHKK